MTVGTRPDLAARHRPRNLHSPADPVLPAQAAAPQGRWSAPPFVESRCWNPGRATPGGGFVGRRGYPPEFRRKVLDLVASGRPIVHVARDLGISAQSIYPWRGQDRIDKALEQGLTARRSRS